MSGTVAPYITRNGLIMCLDAGNIKSYPKSGTSWRDLSNQNINYSLINGPTYDTANGGNILFDGSDDYVEPSTDFVISTGPRTIFFWIKSTDDTTIRGIIGARVSTTGWGLAHNYGLPGRILYFHQNPGGGSIDSLGYDITLNEWNNYAITYDSTSGIMKLYKNGVYAKQTTGNGDGVTTSATKIRVGSGSGHGQFKGNIGLVHAYNRALSDSEISQNYRATKIRYGL